MTPADTLVEGFAIDDIISHGSGRGVRDLSTAEVTGNTYDLLVRLDLNDTSKVKGDLAESWTVSDDGLTYTFKLKPGLKFASGNPITADDVAYSFERAVKLDKSPAFIIGQFGISGDNVAEKAKAVDDTTFQFTVDKAYAPSFVLNCLIGNGRLGRRQQAGQGTCRSRHAERRLQIRQRFRQCLAEDRLCRLRRLSSCANGAPTRSSCWSATTTITARRPSSPASSTATSRKARRSAWLLEKPATSTSPAISSRNDLDAVAKNADLTTTSAPKGTVYYISLNQKNANLAKPEVRQAFKYLVDYDAHRRRPSSRASAKSTRPSCRRACSARVDDNPFKLDVAKAKELLAKAGLPDGFRVTMDVRTSQPITGIAESIQQTLAQAGIKIEIIPGDGKQTLTKYRARKHDIYIGQWGAGLSGSEHQRRRPSPPTPTIPTTASRKTLAWRNAWDIPELTKQTDAALLEQDAAKRAECTRSCRRRSWTPARSSSSSSRPKWPACARTSRTSSSGRLRHQLRRHGHQGIAPANAPALSAVETERRAGRGSARAVAIASCDRPLPGHRGHDLSRPARGDLLHRPRHPDRSGAGGRRRPRAGTVSSSARARRWASTCRSIEQFCIYVKKALTGDFGTLGADHQSGDDRHPPRLSGDHRTGDAGHADRRGARRAARRAGGGQARQPHRPDRARHRPDRLFGADLLARPAGAAALLRQARLGRRSRPPRRRLRIHLHADHRLLPARRRRAAASGTSSATSFATSSCRPRCSAISRSPISAA